MVGVGLECDVKIAAREDSAGMKELLLVWTLTVQEMKKPVCEELATRDTWLQIDG